MIKKNKTAFYLLLIMAACMILESCATTKDCGCGSNINRAYKQPKRYH